MIQRYGFWLRLFQEISPRMEFLGIQYLRGFPCLSSIECGYSALFLLTKKNRTICINKLDNLFFTI